MKLDDFLTPDEQQRIVEAIAEAERMTSGEIRVHVTPTCDGDPLEQAREVFAQLEMYKTRQRNGILLFLAFESRQFAIVGDEGIDNVVPDDYWNSERDILMGFLKRGEAARGIEGVIRSFGEKLKAHFPIEEDDVDELSNEISYAD